MTDVVQRAREALNGLGTTSSVADIERYAEWLRDGGPRDLLAEVDRLRAVVGRALAEVVDYERRCGMTPLAAWVKVALRHAEADRG
ncbi:hypothetical protein M2272_005893 [Mycobacterium frederiksbergense]|uniref:HNH endonuclease n=1 Tax=Mycolicibacterium frederiksbergense TaxID=117567 RepID=A0ABT6LA19_9MYCO|nr:hypothetical protein [Mycolicibacterium frederiksbergense]MDH6199225.1 hypothetical protein [Mycolicibacterium frederiksbergense]